LDRCSWPTVTRDISSRSPPGWPDPSAARASLASSAILAAAAGKPESAAPIDRTIMPVSMSIRAAARTPWRAMT
jgi:hypothetical protein